MFAAGRNSEVMTLGPSVSCSTLHNAQKIIYFVKGYIHGLHYYKKIKEKIIKNWWNILNISICKIKYIFWYKITFVILDVRLRQKKSTRFVRENLGDVPSNLCQNCTRFITLHVVGNYYDIMTYRHLLQIFRRLIDYV